MVHLDQLGFYTLRRSLLFSKYHILYPLSPLTALPRHQNLESWNSAHSPFLPIPVSLQAVDSPPEQLSSPSPPLSPLPVHRSSLSRAVPPTAEFSFPSILTFTQVFSQLGYLLKTIQWLLTACKMETKHPGLNCPPDPGPFVSHLPTFSQCSVTFLEYTSFTPHTFSCVLPEIFFLVFAQTTKLSFYNIQLLYTC